MFLLHFLLMLLGIFRYWAWQDPKPRDSQNAQTFTTGRIKFPVCNYMRHTLPVWWASKHTRGAVWELVLVWLQKPQPLLPMIPLSANHSPAGPGHGGFNLHKPAFVPGLFCHWSEIMSEREQVWTDENSHPAALTQPFTHVTHFQVRKDKAQRKDLRSKCPKQVHKSRFPTKPAAQFYTDFAPVLNQITQAHVGTLLKLCL